MVMVWIAYCLGIIGMAIVCDGVASLYTYLPDPKQTWKRDHLLRCIRCFYGIVLMIMGALVLWQELML